MSCDGAPIESALVVAFGEEITAFELAAGEPAVVAHDALASAVIDVRVVGAPRVIRRVAAPVPAELQVDVERRPAGDPAVAWITLIDGATGRVMAGGEVWVAVASFLEPAGTMEAIETDGNGHAWVDLEQGRRYTFSAPGARQRDGVPHRLSVLVPPMDASGDKRIVLVTPPRTWPVRVRTQLTELAGPIPPILFAQRVAGGPTTVIPLSGVSVDAAGLVDAELPRGRYLFGIGPGGDYRVEGPTVVDVPADSAGPIELFLAARPNLQRARVELVGPGPDEYPGRLFAVDPMQQVVDLDSAVWIGPPKWTRPVAEVPTLDQPRVLVFEGRRGARMSNLPVEIAGEAASVTLVPACSIDLRGPREPDDADATLVVESGGAAFAQVLTPRWDVTSGVPRPVWVGRLHAPAGEAAIEVWMGSDQVFAWKGLISGRRHSIDGW